MTRARRQTAPAPTDPTDPEITTDHVAAVAFVVGHAVEREGNGPGVAVFPAAGLFITGFPHRPLTVDAGLAAALVESGAFTTDSPPAPPPDATPSADLPDPAAAGSLDS